MIFKRPKPTPQRQTPAAPEPSYIARETTVEGNLFCSGEVHIDGTVQGLVRAHTCLVDRQGEVRGEISAEVVYVRGRVMGPINAVHVQIESGAHVEGDVTNETISIENGAYVLGSIRRVAPPPAPLAQPSFTALEAPGDFNNESPKPNVHLFTAKK
ncbi:MAG: polymer-forming cytoskeletal protein [Alphaproteobacteria bacterium]|nr:polymer-forming cytoskeletal protein [Alphaproteobacteria bacterium]